MRMSLGGKIIVALLFLAPFSVAQTVRVDISPGNAIPFDPDKALSPADGLPSQSRSDFVAVCARMPSTEGAVRRSTQAVI